MLTGIQVNPLSKGKIDKFKINAKSKLIKFLMSKSEPSKLLNDY